jgi:hypothetical protein
VLEDAGERLKWAWERDMKYPNSYPLNTSFAFHEIKGRIVELRSPSQAEKKTLKLALVRHPPPRSFSDLVGNGTIRAVYEEQNVGSYVDALARARSGDKSATRAFQEILNAVEAAYYIEHFGVDAAQKPRVHFLHGKLLAIADLSGVSDLTPTGFVEFLDDLCPCRKKHTPDAIRKLRKRHPVRRRQSPPDSGSLKGSPPL